MIKEDQIEYTSLPEGSKPTLIKLMRKSEDPPAKPPITDFSNLL